VRHKRLKNTVVQDGPFYQDDELLDESLTITFDRSTTSISVWDGDVELGSIRKIVNTEEARAEVRASMTAGANSIK